MMEGLIRSDDVKLSHPAMHAYVYRNQQLFYFKNMFSFKDLNEQVTCLFST